MAQVPAQRGGQGGGMTQRRQQYQPMDLFRRQMDDLFNQFLGGSMMAPSEEMRVWDFTVQESDNEIFIRAELPGFEEKEIDVRLEDDILTISAEKQESEAGRQEYRSYYRSLALPGSIDADQVEANYRNGVLEMHIPRPEGTKPRRIQVKGQEESQSGQQVGQAKSQTAGQQTQSKSQAPKEASKTAT